VASIARHNKEWNKNGSIIPNGGFLCDAIITIMVNKTTMVVFAHVGCGWDLKVCQI
jgi:hypothetical protein